MELVSANTKNYLYLTLSQFNEEDRLARARVSMRRDQPFWEGGNSFIACESFRITSAPNEGGLYYNTVDPSFFIGGTLNDSVPAPAAAVYNPLINAAPPGFDSFDAATGQGVPRSADKLVASRVVIQNTDISADLHCSKPDGTPIDEGNTYDIIPRYSTYFGPHRVQQG